MAFRFESPAFNFIIASKDDLEKISTPELIEGYNYHARKNIKGFNSRKAGVDQVWALLHKINGVALPKESEPEVQTADTTTTSATGTEPASSESDPATTEETEEMKNKKAGAKKASKKAAKKTAKKSAVKTTTKKASGGKRSQWSDSAKITILVDGNPKREGTMAHAKFAAIRNGMTVGGYKAKENDAKPIDTAPGWAMAELRWCVKKKFIKITEQ